MMCTPIQVNELMKDIIDYLFCLKVYILSLTNNKTIDLWNEKEFNKKRAEERVTEKAIAVPEPVELEKNKVRSVIDGAYLKAQSYGGKFRRELQVKLNELELSCNMQMVHRKKFDEL